MKAQLLLKLMKNNHTNRGGIIDIMTSTLKIYKNNDLVNTLNVEGEEAYRQLSIILLRHCLCKTKSNVSYRYDKQGCVINIEVKINNDYTYKYEFEGLDTVL